MLTAIIPRSTSSHNEVHTCTSPSTGDIVFDGFAGTGMTGVAAKICEKPDTETKYKIERI